MNERDPSDVPEQHPEGHLGQQQQQQVELPAHNEDNQGEDEEQGDVAASPHLEWSLDTKSLPFPLSLESHIVCCCLIGCIIIGNLEAQWHWGLDCGLWDFLGHVSYRTMITVILALASPLVFEHFLDKFTESQNWVVNEIRILFLKSVAGLWSIRIDPDLEVDPTHQLLGREGETWEIPQAISDLLTEGYLLAFYFAWILVLDFMGRAISVLTLMVLVVLPFQDVSSRIGLWKTMEELAHDRQPWQTMLESSNSTGKSRLREYVVDFVTFVNKGELWVDYTPDTDGIWITALMVGVEVSFQLIIIAVLSLIVFILRAQALQSLMLDQNVLVMEKIRARAAYLRLSAVHLVSYTAYHVISFILASGRLVYMRAVTETKWEWNIVAGPKGGKLDFLGEDLFLSVAIGMLTLVIHTILRIASRTLIRFCSSISTSWILWTTLFTAGSVRQIVEEYLKDTAEDFSLDDRVMYRTLMSLLFGDLGPLPMALPGGHNEDVIW